MTIRNKADNIIKKSKTQNTMTESSSTHAKPYRELRQLKSSGIRGCELAPEWSTEQSRLGRISSVNGRLCCWTQTEWAVFLSSTEVVPRKFSAFVFFAEDEGFFVFSSASSRCRHPHCGKGAPKQIGGRNNEQAGINVHYSGRSPGAGGGPVSG